MHRRILRISVFLLFFLPGTVTCVLSQVDTTLSYRILFYNTGNFFDTVNDSLKEDDDFLPDGVMRWNYSRYKTKVNSVYKVITASGGWEPPAVVCLCEVENRKVLMDLAYGTYLSKYNYGIVHFESNDPRGIDLAILYRKDAVELLDTRPLIPDGYDGASFRTRSVLYSKWLIAGDTLHLFFNHWPSRRGGVLPGEDLRKAIAGMVLQKSDSISQRVGGRAKIIIGGDFNCTPDDSEIKIITGNIRNGENVNRFTNLSESLKNDIPGTYKYRGVWEMLDQIIVSDRLLNAPKGLFTSGEKARIFSPAFMLQKDKTYPGSTPYGTYSGYRYSGGFSDHLPVYLDLMSRSSAK